MADQWYGGQQNSGERWNVNLPAIVGVVFVFLLGVVIWVIASSGGDDDPDSVQSVDTVSSTLPTTTAPPVATTLPAPVTTLPPATSPQPMPATTVPAATAPPATAPPATAPPPTAAPITTIAAATTTRPTAPPEQGDLGVPGHPIQRPPCEGGYITVIGSAIGNEATPESLDALLDRYAGSSYLRTDQTCPSLTPAQNGQPIYVVYLGPYAVDTDACAARADGPSGSYVRRLSTTLGPDHSVTCA